MENNLTPAIHKKWIKEGKMTKDKSNSIVKDWQSQQLKYENIDLVIEQMITILKNIK